MALHVIAGASASGVATAKLLAERGEQVRLVSRRGTGPEHAGIEQVAADATDAERLTALTAGAVALYSCANPAYDRWLTDWPPLASSLLTAAERTGAVLASMAPLYGYGPVTGPMTERTPLVGPGAHPKLRLRAQMWRDALAAHDAGRIRVTEVRASDLVQGTGGFSLSVAKPLLAGKRAVAATPLDQPHTFTSVNDVAAALVAVAADERAWGKPWHVPSNDPVTLRQLAHRFVEVTGSGAPKLTTMPYPVLWAAGVAVSIVRELRITHYQWDRPFVMDSTAATRVFGLKPEPLDDALRDAARLLRA
ncbi:NAD-dependent epimerase [Streptomyces sp. NBC_00487]|uniref:NAD-dependent epimerase n=1 Tax=unclassified Streptomyces TaxID=2593676 RepID=UPI002E19D1B6|nr:MULTISPECIES: NAD-dependent epimerase [unclassified Streptomyces]